MQFGPEQHCAGRAQAARPRCARAPCPSGRRLPEAREDADEAPGPPGRARRQGPPRTPPPAWPARRAPESPAGHAAKDTPRGRASRRRGGSRSTPRGARRRTSRAATSPPHLEVSAEAPTTATERGSKSGPRSRAARCTTCFSLTSSAARGRPAGRSACQSATQEPPLMHEGPGRPRRPGPFNYARGGSRPAPARCDSPVGEARCCTRASWCPSWPASPTPWSWAPRRCGRALRRRPA